MLCPSGPLSKGRKFDLGILLLARPGGGCNEVGGLLDLERLLGCFVSAACGFQICRAGHLFLRKVSSCLARGDPFAIDNGQEAAFVRNVPLLGVLRVAVRSPEFHGRLLTKRFLARHGFVQ
ncbi:MAG: hypothetical protein EOP82_06750 [Variovorax sp.]|nr:MAG: hypothetical protein EOP82_06750 [Variovorax sp.]